MIWFKKVKLERNADYFGREFWEELSGGPETLEKQGQKIQGENSLTNSLRKIVGKFSTIHQTELKKYHPKSALQNLRIKRTATGRRRQGNVMRCAMPISTSFTCGNCTVTSVTHEGEQRGIKSKCGINSY